MNLHQILNDIENMDDAQITEIAREVRSLLDGMADDERRKSRDDQQEAEALDSLIERQNTDETRKRLVELRKKRDPLAGVPISVGKINVAVNGLATECGQFNERATALEDKAKDSPYDVAGIQRLFEVSRVTIENINYKLGEYDRGFVLFSDFCTQRRTAAAARVEAAKREQAEIEARLTEMEAKISEAKKSADVRIAEAQKSLKKIKGVNV